MFNSFIEAVEDFISEYGLNWTLKNTQNDTSISYSENGDDIVILYSPNHYEIYCKDVDGCYWDGETPESLKGHLFDVWKIAKRNVLSEMRKRNNALRG